MTVPKEIAIKADRYEMLKKEVDKLYEELKSWASEHGFEDMWIHDFGTTQEPVGDEQDGGEYCDQTMTGEDTGYGDYYYPIEGSSQYMRIEYSETVSSFV